MFLKNILHSWISMISFYLQQEGEKLSKNHALKLPQFHVQIYSNYREWEYTSDIYYNGDFYSYVDKEHEEQ